MNPILVVGPECHSCREAEAVWQRACGELGLVLDIEVARGSEATKTIPLLVAAGVPVFAGIPSLPQARQVLSDRFGRQPPGGT